MKNNFKIKRVLVVISVLLVAGVACLCDLRAADSAAVMQDMGRQLQTAAETGGYGEPTDPRTTASLIIRSMLGLIGTVMLGLMLYAGFLWMTAAGNEDKIDKAKKIITSAAIGLIIVLLSYSITWFLTFTAMGGRSTQVPEDLVDPYAPMSDD